PSMTTEVLVPRPCVSWTARASAAADFMEPMAPLILAMRASVCSAANLGMANAARIPRMVITTISSISVKPQALRLMLLLLMPISLPTSLEPTSFISHDVCKHPVRLRLEPAIGLCGHEPQPDCCAVPGGQSPHRLDMPAHARTPLGFGAEVSVLVEHVYQLLP